MVRHYSGLHAVFNPNCFQHVKQTRLMTVNHSKSRPKVPEGSQKTDFKASYNVHILQYLALSSSLCYFQPMIKTYPVKNPTPEKAAKLVTKRLTRIQDYPRGARIATVKALSEMEYSQNKIASLLGMSKDTVSEYLDATIEDRWVNYSTAIKRIMTERNDVLKYKVGNVIDKKLDQGTNLKLYELTGLYKVLTDVDRVMVSHTNPTLHQVINVHPALERKHPITIDGE